MVLYTAAQIMEQTVEIGRMVEAMEELESKVSGIAALKSDIAELKSEVKGLTLIELAMEESMRFKFL